MIRSAVVLAFLALVALPADAAGILVPRSGGEPIAIESYRVTATVTDGVARTKIRQTFVNRRTANLEAIYVFPLPEGAALVDVAMEVDGKRLEGLLAERRQARKVYDDIVRSRRDPALVEQIGHGKFRLSVFPVVPNKPTVVEISYLEHLPLSGGEFRYVHPLSIGGEVTRTLADLTIAVRLRSSVPFAAVESDAKDAAISRRSPQEAVVSLERSQAPLDRDLVVTGAVEVPKATLTVRTFKPEKGDGYFAAILTPPPLAEEKILPRDIVLVLDTSGSMGAENRIEQAKAAARHLLAGLRSQDRVNLLRFASDVVSFAKKPVPATKENIAALRSFISGTRAAGGTALARAIDVATGMESTPGRVPIVVLLSDGKPTIGVTESVAIVAAAREGGKKGVRLYPFGVGADVDSGLLRGIARATGGRAEIFRPGGEVESRIVSFLDRSGAPAVIEVKMTAPGVTLHDVFPRPIPVTGVGEQVVICGRFRGGEMRRAMLSAILGDEPLTLTASVMDAGIDRSVPDLYARRKLDFLEEELRLRTGLSDEAYFAALDRGRYSTRDELVEEIIRVSLEHGVQSAYTSFIVLLPEDRKRIDPRDLKAIEEALSDPAIRDAKVADHGETDNDLPFEESIGKKDFVSDAPFDGPSTGAAIGIGGGAGGAFGARGGHRNLRAEGGSKRTQTAVDWGMKWLKDQQRSDGSWEGPRANTGLALLAFLGAGETHKHGNYKKSVKAGLRYLKQVQEPDGNFADRNSPDWLREHAIATLAMAEAYALTGSPLFKTSAQMGIDFLHRAQVPFLGWGRGIRAEPCDPATTVWAVCALESAKAAGLRTSQDAFDGALAWFSKAKLGDEWAGGEILARIFCGEDPRKSETIRKKTALCLARPPKLDGTSIVDLAHVHFSTLAMFQCGRSSWKEWNEALKKTVLEAQLKDPLELKGSWTAAGAEGKALGRVGATALACLTKEVYYRYGRVFGTRR